MVLLSLKTALYMIIIFVAFAVTTVTLWLASKKRGSKVGISGQAGDSSVHTEGLDEHFKKMLEDVESPAERYKKLVESIKQARERIEGFLKEVDLEERCNKGS